MGFLVVDVLAGLLFVLLWFWAFSRYNRRKAAKLVQLLRTALGSHAYILGTKWSSSSRLLIRLRLSPALFQQLVIRVELYPRELALNWLWSRLRRRKETLTFEADFDCPPAFNLEVHNHRWVARTGRKAPRHSRRVAIDQCEPFVLTTRGDWQREITAMMNALVASRDSDFLSVCFRRNSPHFSATVPLDSLGSESNHSQIFDVLRELANCASAASF